MLTVMKRCAPEGEWKLGGLEFCLPVESWGNEIFNELPSILLDEVIPPQSNVWRLSASFFFTTLQFNMSHQAPTTPTSSIKSHSRDIWAFGTLLSSLASQVNTEGNHDFSISLSGAFSHKNILSD